MVKTTAIETSLEQKFDLTSGTGIINVTQYLLLILTLKFYGQHLY